MAARAHQRTGKAGPKGGSMNINTTRRLLSRDGTDLGPATPEQIKESDAEGSGTGMIAVWWPSGDLPVPGERVHGEDGLEDVYVA